MYPQHMNSPADEVAVDEPGSPAALPAFDTCSIRVVHPQRVARAQGAIPEQEDVAELAATFGLLSDPGRLRLLTALLDGEMCVCDLAAASGQGESAVSHALRLLRAARVVRVRRDGRMAYYSLADDHVRVLLTLALTHQGHAPGRHVQLVGDRAGS